MSDPLPSPRNLPIALFQDESIDALGYGELQIIQSSRGFRYTIDPILLTDFVQIKNGEEWIDLGCGSGIIPLLLARRDTSIRITGVEIDPQSADRAARNIKLNRFEDQITILPCDLRHLRSMRNAQSFDVVITNPPYRQTGRGRISTGEERSIARHEIHGSLDDFLDCSRYLLKNGGRLYMIHLAERLPEIFRKMTERMIEPKKLRCLYPDQGRGANLVLIEGRRSAQPGLTVLPPLWLDEANKISAEIA